MWQGVAPKKQFHQVPALFVARQQGLGGRGLGQGSVYYGFERYCVIPTYKEERGGLVWHEGPP